LPTAAYLQVPAVAGDNTVMLNGRLRRNSLPLTDEFAGFATHLTSSED
jgi:hypothetical protein